MERANGRISARKASRNQRGQISTEVLLLIGVMLVVLVPLILYAYGRANAARDDFSDQRAEFASQRLARLADSVGYLGGAAAVVDQIDIPPYVKSVSLSPNHHDIIFEMNSPAGKKEIVQSSVFQINATGLERISREGSYFIEVRALSNYEPGADQVGMRVR